jgi:4,5-dihydroxyphthalate decarboxylase
MCRNQEFDVCEMAITTYLTARRYGLPFTAIPVFPVRLVAHDAITCNTATGVHAPKEIEGKAVGVRAYTVTTGVWVRGILASQFGVDLNKVTWVLADDEHVQAFQKDAPPNTDYRIGADLTQLLSDGEICAAIGAGPTTVPTVKPLIDDPKAAARRLFEETGIYPINHTIVIKDSIIAANPWLPITLFEAFKAAKEQWLAEASDADKQVTGTGIPIDDPIPYGLEPNRKALETVIRYANEQQIIPRYRLEEVFERSTLDLS